jgi:hypothetical protein
MTLKKFIIALIILALIVVIFNPMGLRDKLMGSTPTATTDAE